jgi:mannosyltransferase
VNSQRTEWELIGGRPEPPGTVLSVSSPQTSPISVTRPTTPISVRAGLRGLPGVLAGAAARTPEITIGALGVIISAAFSWVPSLWYDEGATVTSARRTWPQLWAELHNVDAVHGFYYALMHCWFWLVGYSPFSLRFPSALAIGVAAALVVALGRRLGGRRLGIVAGIVYVLLPRVNWAGTEGRPYATITAFSACLTLVGLTAVRRSRTSSRARTTAWWAAYAVVAALAVTFNIYLSLVVIAHGVALVWTMVAERRAARRDAVTVRSGTPAAPLVSRRLVVAWILAAAAAAVAVSPFVLEVIRQSKQVGWIGPIRWATLQQVFATAWFGSSPVFATVAWVLMAAGVTLALLRLRRTTRTGDLVRAQAVRVVLPLVVVPTGLLLTATALGEHLYSPKYASLSLPFVAILMALALTAIRPRAPFVLALALVVAVAIAPAVAVKLPHAKQNTYWPQAAAIVQHQRALHPAADEGVIYGSVVKHPSTTAQIIADAYPTAFEGMTDLAAVTNGAERGRLWDTNGDIATTVPARLGDIDTVWFVGGTTRNIEPQVTTTLGANGFHVAGYWKAGSVIITEYTR